MCWSYPDPATTVPGIDNTAGSCFPVQRTHKNNSFPVQRTHKNNSFPKLTIPMLLNCQSSFDKHFEIYEKHAFFAAVRLVWLKMQIGIFW